MSAQAHTTLWPVLALEFIYNSFYPKNAFAGRLLVRPGASGHMLVQHYLDPMFDKGNTFLDSRYTLDDLHRTGQIKDDPKAETYAKSKKKVREVSRLAGYLGGNKQKWLGIVSWQLDSME
jgi:hypothetical protein